MSEDRLTIRMEARHGSLDAQAFLRIVSSSIDGMKRLSKVREPAGKAQRWQISALGMNSPATIELSPLRSGRREAEAWTAGMRIIQEENRVPPGWDTRTLDKARDVAAELLNGVARIEFRANGEVFFPTTKLYGNIAELSSKAPRAHRGKATMIGTLYNIHTHGDHPHFAIYHPVSDTPTQCDFQDADLDRVMLLIRQRIQVYGIAHYNADGKAERIEVEKFSTMPSVDELEFERRLQTSHDITGGVDSVEYVAEQRGYDAD